MCHSFEHVRPLAKELLTRLPEARVLPRWGVSQAEWIPTAGDCHRNVRRLVADRPELRHVVGYVVYDFIRELGFARLWAHSVVETPAGALHEVTPRASGLDYPFLRHTGDAAEFVKVASHVWLDVSAVAPMDSLWASDTLSGRIIEYCAGLSDERRALPDVRAAMQSMRAALLDMYQA